jgi:hypothetical protein
MQAGERNVIVTLQSRSATDAADASGAPVEAEWATLVESMPAGKYDIGGTEQFAAAQLSARYNTRFEINYRPDMDPDLLDVPKLRRVLYRSRVHDIVAASLIGRRDGVELMTLSRQG